MSFPIIDRYVSFRLDGDLAALQPGRTQIVESERRLRCEGSYGFVHALWWMWLEDGRSLVSVPPGAGEGVRALVDAVRTSEELYDPALADRLRPVIDAALARHGRAACDRPRLKLVFACDAAHLRRHTRGDCRRLVDGDIPGAEDLYLPTHCFPDGIVYGVVADGRVVSVANAHRTGLMEDVVADLGVETSAGYRRRGYAQTVVSAVAGEITARGGEAIYICNPTNLASAATARSVGFQPYAHGLALGAPGES